MLPPFNFFQKINRKISWFLKKIYKGLETVGTRCLLELAIGVERVEITPSRVESSQAKKESKIQISSHEKIVTEYKYDTTRSRLSTLHDP